MVSKQITIILIILSFCSCNLSDGEVELGYNYYYIHEGGENNVIAKQHYHDGDNFIPCNVTSYSYNDNFIIAMQKPAAECFFGNDKNIYGSDSIYYWIVDHKKNLFLGPLSFSEYSKKRIELNVPPDLILKKENE